MEISKKIIDNKQVISREFNFGSDEVFATKLRNLVLEGKKTATTGLYRDGKDIPKIGDMATVTDSSGKKFCAIEYTKVSVVPFMEVDFEYVMKEGEGASTIEEWRESHRDFFRREYPNLFNDDSRVVCEEFKVVSVL